MSIAVRPMREGDLAAADRIYRRAFGTFFGLAEPASFRGDSALIRPRFTSDPAAAFVAEADGGIVGSIMAADWGSVGVLGPLTVDPDHWGRGIARALVPPVLELFARRGVTLAALFTHPQSPKHFRLYEEFGFEPGAVTAVMAKEITARSCGMEDTALLSRLPAAARKAALIGCKALTTSLYDGLDLAREIEALLEQRLGECILLRDEGTAPGSAAIAGVAICHHGAGSEAGSAALYVKFAAVRPGTDGDFTALLERCEGLAAALGARNLIAGVNTARRRAYRLMRAAGFRTFLTGIAMHRPDQPGYDCPEIFAIDDLR